MPVERHLDYAAVVDYMVRRWFEHGPADARLAATRFERKLGLDKEKLLAAARAQREAQP